MENIKNKNKRTGEEEPRRQRKWKILKIFSLPISRTFTSTSSSLQARVDLVVAEENKRGCRVIHYLFVRSGGGITYSMNTEGYPVLGRLITRTSAISSGLTSDIYPGLSLDIILIGRELHSVAGASSLMP